MKPWYYIFGILIILGLIIGGTQAYDYIKMKDAQLTTMQTALDHAMTQIEALNSQIAYIENDLEASKIDLLNTADLIVQYDLDTKLNNDALNRLWTYNELLTQFVYRSSEENLKKAFIVAMTQIEGSTSYEITYDYIPKNKLGPDQGQYAQRFTATLDPSVGYFRVGGVFTELDTNDMTDLYHEVNNSTLAQGIEVVLFFHDKEIVQIFNRDFSFYDLIPITQVE